MASLKQALDRLGPVGRNVVLFGAPVAVGAALLTRRGGGGGAGLVGGKEGAGPQAVGGGGVGPDAIAGLGDYINRLYDGVMGEISAVNARLDAGLTPTPSGTALPPAPVPVPAGAAPAAAVPATQTAPLLAPAVAQLLAKVDVGTVVRHTERVAEIAAQPAFGDYIVSAPTPTAMGGAKTVVMHKSGRRSVEIITPSTAAVKDRAAMRAGEISREEFRRRVEARLNK